MTPHNADDLTYAEFVKRRAAALSRIHRAKAMQSQILDPRYTQLTPDAAVLAQRAIDVAEFELVQILRLWARSKYNQGG